MVSDELPQIGGATGLVVQRLTEQVSVISEKKILKFQRFLVLKRSIILPLESADTTLQCLQTVWLFSKIPF